MNGKQKTIYSFRHARFSTAGISNASKTRIGTMESGILIRFADLSIDMSVIGAHGGVITRKIRFAQYPTTIIPAFGIPACDIRACQMVVAARAHPPTWPNCEPSSF